MVGSVQLAVPKRTLPLPTLIGDRAASPASSERPRAVSTPGSWGSVLATADHYASHSVMKREVPKRESAAARGSSARGCGRDSPVVASGVEDDQQGDDEGGADDKA